MSYLVRKRSKKEEGFTLIELVIVIAIIGILMAIAIPNYMKARQAAAVSATKANLRNLATALELYMAEEGLNTYPPAKTTGTVKGINDALKDYFNGPAPTNPAGKNYVYAPKTSSGGAASSTDPAASFLIGDPDNYGTSTAAVYYQVGPGGSIQELPASGATGGEEIKWSTEG